MKNYLSIIALVFGLIITAGATEVVALETEANLNVHGVVIDIDAEQIIVQEIKEEGDQISQFEIAISKETMFTEDSGSADIVQGDEVEIEYIETENGKVAIQILEKAALEAELEVESEILEKL